MQPLTHQVWEQHYVELRQPVLAHFPQLDRSELDGVTDDYDALVALLQRSTGLDADRVLDRLRSLDVEELGLGTGGSGQDDGEGRGSLQQLNLGKGFTDAERGRIVDRLSQLNRHLKRFPADDTWLELTVKDRETTSQVVTLSAELPRLGRLQASSKEDDLAAALADVRQDLIRQIERELDKRSRGAR